MTLPRAILIAGPTASGKSALALALAERYGGTVINADAMQVYREPRILTARPTVEDEARVPHALYGFVPAREAYSAGRFVADAREAIAAAHSVGRLPIIVGGTGLYFSALLEGLSPVPPVTHGIRAHWRAEVARVGAEAAHAMLAARDPDMARRLRPADAQRIARALEVFDSTGRSLAEWQREPGHPAVTEAESIRLVVTIDRGELYRRCDARFERMMAAGALDEAARLKALDLSWDLPAMRALGVRALFQLLDGALTREQAIATAQARTRHYAKRQLSWIKRYMMSWKEMNLEEMKCNDGKIFAFIDAAIDRARSAP